MDYNAVDGPGGFKSHRSYMTVEEAREAVAASLAKFYRDFAYVAPELYPSKFAELRYNIDFILSQIEDRNVKS